MSDENNWRGQTLLLGALIGALTGLGAAYVLVRRAEESGEPPQLGAGEGVRLGMGVLGLLRMISGFGGEAD
ncbi:MAG: hypothetical protein P8X64_15895 [Anaerolineales bacterium]|jgi:hypothetical protein